VRWQNANCNAHAFREHAVTADPNPSQDRIPSSSFETGLSTPKRSDVTTVVEATRRPQGKFYTGFELWLHRITILMFVFVCAVVGVLLVILPWRPEWTDNHLLLASPGLRAFVANGFVRGICSGLGILDIWIGFSEALHYHEEKRT
jgi:hypothetical protein